MGEITRHGHVTEWIPIDRSRTEAYVPYEQDTWTLGLHLMVRASTGAGVLEEVRRAVWHGADNTSGHRVRINGDQEIAFDTVEQVSLRGVGEQHGHNVRREHSLNHWFPPVFSLPRYSAASRLQNFLAANARALRTHWPSPRMRESLDAKWRNSPSAPAAGALGWRRAQTGHRAGVGLTGECKTLAGSPHPSFHKKREVRVRKGCRCRAAFPKELPLSKRGKNGPLRLR